MLTSHFHVPLHPGQQSQPRESLLLLLLAIRHLQKRTCPGTNVLWPASPVSLSPSSLDNLFKGKGNLERHWFCKCQTLLPTVCSSFSTWYIPTCPLRFHTDATPWEEPSATLPEVLMPSVHTAGTAGGCNITICLQPAASRNCEHPKCGGGVERCRFCVHSHVGHTCSRTL